MWRFVFSIYPCSTEGCEGETVVTEPSTGERLCQKCAEEREGALDEAHIYLERYSAGASD
jgi:hypothetical protein